MGERRLQADLHAKYSAATARRYSSRSKIAKGITGS